jgi:RNA polymerase subunit RPABC4/transcription elongation factor Spt4
VRVILADVSTSALLVLIVAVVAYLIVLWVSLAFYVARDARRRSTSLVFAAFAVILGFLPPFLGALIYLVVRPPRTLDEERALLLEEEAYQQEDEDDEVHTRPCPTCGREIEHDFVLCPYCRTQFARRCAACQRSLRLGWTVCPYCAADVTAHGSRQRGRAATS